jgi:small subunit ribosomal protein S6
LYELVYIVRPTVDEQTLAAVKDKVEKFITSAGGTISQRDDWGKRTLAYTIGKVTEGFYTVLQFDLPSTGVRDLERSLGLTEEILRHLVVRQEAPAPTPTPSK